MLFIVGLWEGLLAATAILLLLVDGAAALSPYSFSTDLRKASLDVALGSLVWWLATLHIAGGENSMITVVLFNPGHSMII